jgi:hypothetical protein
VIAHKVWPGLAPPPSAHFRGFWSRKVKGNEVKKILTTQHSWRCDVTSRCLLAIGIGRERERGGETKNNLPIDGWCWGRTT